MKISFVRPIVVFFFFACSANCQQQFYFETFNNITNTFTINDTQLGSNRGNNKWIVDTNYFGGGIYPNTVNENTTYVGSILGAPYSQYLHIYDSASHYLNDNYNPDDSSTRFTHMTTGICTKSLTNLNLNFYYLCQGSATAYGNVYYSINGGPWIQTGSNLNNRYKWQYTSITNPAFSNVEDLRFGFLWHNDKTAGNDTSGLGIDDISISGIYDSIGHPIKCSFTTLSADSCLGENPYLLIQASLTDSTCTANWDLYMSDNSGNFPGPYAWTQYISPASSNDINSIWNLTIPNSYSMVGSCYKFKLVRTTYPYLTFLDSVCFPFDSCTGNITALQPPTTLDTNPVCAGSVIDVPFTSTGIYAFNNIYYAQLIDSIGHTAEIDTIGYLTSGVAYPSSLTPGDITGTIPLTADTGCHYYIRVVSTTPNRVPTFWGPFCIQHCDILTNSQQNIEACLQSCQRQPQGYSDTIKYNIHEFDSRAHYHNGNKFEVQLIQFSLSPVSFSTINTGLFGALTDTTNGKIYIHVPCPDTLAMYGISPGIYYLRIIADSSNFSDSSLGSLIHLNIGEPADSLYLKYTPVSNTYCAGSIITFLANPQNPNSTYNWWETDKTNGTYPFANVNAGILSLDAATADTLLITCQENSYGCLGNKATIPDSIIIIGPPSITKTGPTTLCLGDTGTYSIPFQGSTAYSWKTPQQAHADTANNTLKIEFDSAGVYRISVQAFNSCFNDSAVWSVHVLPDSLCTLSVTAINAQHYSISIYPNPNNGLFTLLVNSAEQGVSEIQIYNMFGEKVYQAMQTLPPKEEIDLSNQPDGVYLYRVLNGDGTLAGTGKLVIQK